MSELKGRQQEPMTHPDPEVLAEFRAGLIPGRRGARISAHLAACEHCTSLCGDLAEMSVLLASIPHPALPDQLAQRLDGVLAAEVAGRDESQPAAVHHGTAPATSPPPRRRRDRPLVAWRVLAPAAAVVVLAAGGYSLSRLASGPPTLATSGPVVTTVSQPQSASPTSPFQLRPNAIPAIGASFQLTSSRTDYLRATLGSQLEREVQLNAQGTAGPREPAPLAVKGCVHRLTQDISPGTVVLAETAYFQGQPAIVVVAVSGDTDRAWVTTPSCSASSAGLLDETTLAGTSAP